MPKRGAIALALTALALVLLLNFQDPSGIAPVSASTASRGSGPAVAGTPAQGTAGGAGTSGGGVEVTPRPATGSGGSGSSGTGASGGAGRLSGTSTVSGPTVNTRFGPVQVSVTMQNGRITDIRALQLPDGDRRSSSISSQVEPMLRSQALAAQNANIDGVSGATYTSIAYARSLQAALDSAGA